MGALLRRLRRHLTYANVMATITAFVVLAGGAAIAANQVGKSSVGKKQLKRNAVTTAKIRKAAVTAAKIRNGAIDGTKVKDGSLGLAHLVPATWPYSRVVYRTQSSTSAAVGDEFTVLPLDTPAYTQAAGQNNFFIGVVDVTFDPGCEPNRSVQAQLTIDAADPTKPLEGEVVASGAVGDEAGGALTKRLTLSGAEAGGARFAPDSAVNHTLALVLQYDCNAGGGVTASNAAIDVIGIG
jgi:hypothetical protein